MPTQAEIIQTLIHKSPSTSTECNLLTCVKELVDLRRPVRVTAESEKVTITIEESLFDNESEFITALLNYCFQPSTNMDIDVVIAKKNKVEIETTRINKDILNHNPEVIQAFYKNNPEFLTRNKKFHLYFLTALVEEKQFLLIKEHLDSLPKKQLAELLPDLISELIAGHSLNQFSTLLQQEEIKALINDTYPTHYYLHLALKRGSIEDATLLASLLDPKVVNLNGLGQTVLHYCQDDLAFLDIALKFTPDINTQDKMGNTSLHIAAQSDKLKKFAMLLYLGANEDIKNLKGKTCWDLCSDSAIGLYEYALYKKEGIALSVPPITSQQEGLTCGFFAVNQAAHHVRKVSDQRLFSKPLLPALKRQTHPKSAESLRGLRKSLGIEGVGAIFSAQQLVKVIEATECKGVICEIENRDQFVQTIKKALEANFPIIIPYSAGDDSPGAAAEPLGRFAHWSMIIGYHPTDDSILFAQDGKFVEEKITVLFNAFFNIEDTFQAEKIIKKGKEWMKADEKDSDANIVTKTSVMPTVSLQDFRRRLVIVTPPGMEDDKLNELQTNLSPGFRQF